MVFILGITAFEGGAVLNDWWEWTLVAIICASGLIGIIAFVWTSYHAICRLFRNHDDTPMLPRLVQERLHVLSRTATKIRTKQPSSKPSSFGVYLGFLNTPLTEEEETVLAQWDTVVLDYNQPGVLDAVNNGSVHLGPYRIARLDLAQLFTSPITDEVTMLQAIYLVSTVCQQTLRQPDQRRYFTGVLVASWRDRISTIMLNGIAKLLSAHGLDIYLEIGPPDFLDSVEQLELKLFAGVVVRNGTILENGERRDFFAMDKMRTTTKAFVSESCMRPFTVMMWDTVDDAAELSHAVARRAHMWCNYHGAIPFVARQGALTNISQARSCEEPLAAFQWLKNRKVMAVHEKFRTSQVLSSEFTSIIDDYLPLHNVFPLLEDTLAGLDGVESETEDDRSTASTLTVQYPEIDQNGALLVPTSTSASFPGLDWSSCVDKRAANPLSCSFDGSVYGPIGCFPIGLNASAEDFAHVLKSQQRLRSLKLLSKMTTKELHEAAGIIDNYSESDSRVLGLIPSSREALKDLSDALTLASDDANEPGQLQVYAGLDSGFHTPSGGQFWAVWEIDPRTSSLIIYTSRSVPDIPALLVHTYLSRTGFSRYQCFLGELGLEESKKLPSSLRELPSRFEQDLGLLSSSETLLFLQHLQYCEWDEKCPLIPMIRSRCEQLLIDDPTYHQLKKLANMDYISGDISDEDLVVARIKWYRLCNLPCLSKCEALRLFRHVDYNFRSVLWYRDHETLDSITSALEKLTNRDNIDSMTDFVLFCIFCAARKAGFEEVYIEVSDRNPLFNQYSDQSAAFAELFALGSRCEAYFDIKPSDIGLLLSHKHREHYNQTENQPPMWIFNAPSFASAYAAAQTDIDPNQKAASMPTFRRFTFLSVFAIPALVDILLLTTTGHGLYLSAFMTYEEQKYATLALMSSLLLSGAIGTWISIGGTYYLISMAFSAANMFVLTRLIGGLAFTAAAGLVGFIVITAVVNVQSGVIFFLYLFGLTAYLTVLAVLSTYQIPGSTFLNGRKAIIAVLPTLIVSPLITIFVGHHDIIIYPCILYLFVFLLILGARRVGTQWVTWYHNIKTLNDKDVKEWYVQANARKTSSSGTAQVQDNPSSKEPVSSVTASPLSDPSSGPPDLFHGLSEPAILVLCRTSLYEAVMKEKNRRFWQRSSQDALVKELANCWESTIFLLDWYSRLTETKRPIPFSSTWNLETQVALESMQQSQKGIKLHNSFIHWRNAGDEVGCGILYFLTALIDRWLDLLQGTHLVGLSAGMNKTFRLAVGLGLAYYLIGAVLLDYKAQHLHTLSEQSAPISIDSIPKIREAKANDQKFRRMLYWKTMGHFLGVHVWALSLSTALLWIFNGSPIAMTMFLSYVGAYTGLLIYQYNKIFSGPHVLMPLFAAVVVGFIVGFTLGGVQSQFQYNNVIALAASTWTAALLSFRTAKLGLPTIFDMKVWLFAKFKRSKHRKIPTDSSETVNIRGLPSQYQIHWSNMEKYHAFNGVGADQEYSQSELKSFVEKLRSGPKENRYRIGPLNTPGEQITAHLLSFTHESVSRLALQAFPAMPYLVQSVVLAWQNGLVKVFIVPMQSIMEDDVDLRAISHYEDGHLTLYVASDSKGATSAQLNISSNCYVIAETLLHASSKTMFGIPHFQAEVVESILVCRPMSDDMYTVSECSKRSMPFGAAGSKAGAFETKCRKDLLRFLCFGYDCDKQWDDLPLDIRKMFLRRCLGARGPYTNTEMSWINSNVPAEDSCTILARIARHDLGAYLVVNKYNFFKNQENPSASEKEYRQITADIKQSHHPVLNRSAVSILEIFTDYVRAPFAYIYHSLGTWIKFFVLAAMADPEFQRELNCAQRNTPRIFAKPATFILTGLWIYCRWFMSVTLPFFLYYRRPDIAALADTVKGSIIAQKKDRIIIRSYGEAETAFVHDLEDGGFKLVFYSGILKQEPAWGHARVTTYDKDMRISTRVEFKNGEITNEFTYEYATKRSNRLSRMSKAPNTKIPLSRNCIRGNDVSAKIQYNHKGHIESGSSVQHGNLMRFKYHYRKNAKYDDELLRAEFVLSHMSANVSWCAPPVRHAEKMERWIPTPRVHEATFVDGADVYECSWLYDHKFHPTITTTLNGEPVDTPDMIRFDWLGVLKKPTRCNFTDENPLLGFTSPTSSFLARLFRTNVKQQEISTSRARSQLWKAWKKRLDLDGVVIRWVDEELLRNEILLRGYWRRRDRGNLTGAEDYLALHADAVMASSDLTSDISAWTPLAIRISDLFSFGQGGDAVIYTRTKALGRDTDENLHVIAVDTGTWPNEGGGVSACRRDLINNLRTIKWHMVVESANDFGLPKHQTEENVESLKVIPLWGLDFMHPCHGMFTNKLDSEVDRLVKEATIKDIQMNFIPTLTALVQGARAINMTQADVKQATRALVNLNTYFQDSRHWKEVWTSDLVKDTWRKLWLADDMPNTQPPNEWFRTELPTLGHFDTALELWFRYLFIFSIPIPEKIPSVFQASHHSVSASYGIVCKIKRNCTLQIWDHAISWRETNLYLSSAMCTLPPFIRNSLLGLMKLTSCLILHHADQILPCADFFNPGWEVEIGSSKGQLTHRNVFRRKVDPIVNGITDMQKFSPVSEIKTKTPTVTMLSHVWFAKDIKTALLAADIIANEWGFKDYQLDIYGALNKSPVYSSECQEILACKGLVENVALKGSADPTMVLANTWLFLNSSVSEGLPLALGEAALTGAPVVCTDVGASLRVLTDPDTGARYSEVVAPNDAYGLARAQINLLAMLDEWAQYADDPPDSPAPVLPHKPTPQDVELITRRMYDKTPQRRKLGMMARTIVQKSFGGERYLREHEQMLWIGKACHEMLGLNRHIPIPPRHPGRMLSLRGRAAAEPPTEASSMLDTQMHKMQHPRPPFVSRGTSFSSINIDNLPLHHGRPFPISDPPSIYDEDEDPETGYSSLVYPNSDKSDTSDSSSAVPPIPRSRRTHSTPPAPVPRPQKAHTRSSAGSANVYVPSGSRKRPSSYQHGPGHGSVYVPSSGPTPSAELFGAGTTAGNGKYASKHQNARRSMVARQAQAGGNVNANTHWSGGESARSSGTGRTRSYLNEVQVAEYGGVK